MLKLLEHKRHLLRMAALFFAGVLAFLVLQALLVPKGFGVYGHYRSGALADNAARPPVFAGRAACADCHDVAEGQKGSKHAAVGCEACHGALAKHVGDPSNEAPPKLDIKKLCLTCHAVNVAKPAKFPHVDPKEHYDGGPCGECHAPHTPEKQPEPKAEKKSEKEPQK